MNLTVLFLIFYILIPCAILLVGIFFLAKYIKQLLGNGVELKANHSLIEKRVYANGDQNSPFDALPALFREDYGQAIVALDTIERDYEIENLSSSDHFFLITLKHVCIDICRGSDNQKWKRSSNYSLLADIIELALSAKKTRNSQEYYSALSNMIRLSLLKERYEPWVPGTSTARGKKKANLGLPKPIEDYAHSLYAPGPALEFARQLSHRQALENVSGDKVLPASYILLRIHHASLLEGNTQRNRGSLMADEGKRVSVLSNKLSSAVNSKNYERVLELLEGDFRQAANRRVGSAQYANVQ